MATSSGRMRTILCRYHQLPPYTTRPLTTYASVSAGPEVRSPYGCHAPACHSSHAPAPLLTRSARARPDLPAYQARVVAGLAVPLWHCCCSGCWLSISSSSPCLVEELEEFFVGRCVTDHATSHKLGDRYEVNSMSVLRPVGTQQYNIRDICLYLMFLLVLNMRPNEPV
jgi:hypothetical protein